MRVNREARAATGEQRRSRTRERLLDAAERVVAEKGFGHLSIDEFVSAAGVSRGTFYNYFPTTTDLVDALNRRVAAHLDGLLAEVARQPGDAATRLARSLHTVLAANLDDPVRGWIGLQVITSRAPRAAAFEARFVALYDEGVRLGQFRALEVTAATAFGFGAMRMIQQDMLSGVAALAHAAQVVALILTAFGLPWEAAERISRDEAATARSQLKIHGNTTAAPLTP